MKNKSIEIIQSKDERKEYNPSVPLRKYQSSKKQITGVSRRKERRWWTLLEVHPQVITYSCTESMLSEHLLSPSLRQWCTVVTKPHGAESTCLVGFESLELSRNLLIL